MLGGKLKVTPCLLANHDSYIIYGCWPAGLLAFNMKSVLTSSRFYVQSSEATEICCDLDSCYHRLHTFSLALLSDDTYLNYS